jgi:hypothetical protein
VASLRVLQCTLVRQVATYEKEKTTMADCRCGILDNTESTLRAFSMVQKSRGIQTRNHNQNRKGVSFESRYTFAQYKERKFCFRYSLNGCRLTSRFPQKTRDFAPMTIACGGSLMRPSYVVVR